MVISLTPDEQAMLRPEYDEYLKSFGHLVHLQYQKPMSFDQWWREAADEAKDRAKEQRGL